MGWVRAYIPDRKVWAGGVFIVAAYILSGLMNRYLGVGLSIEEVFFLSVAVGKTAEYFLPPSLWDKIRRLNDEVIAIAARVPNVPVSPEVGDVAATTIGDSPGAATQPLAGSVEFEELMARIPPEGARSGRDRPT